MASRVRLYRLVGCANLPPGALQTMPTWPVIATRLSQHGEPLITQAMPAWHDPFAGSTFFYLVNYFTTWIFRLLLHHLNRSSSVATPLEYFIFCYTYPFMIVLGCCAILLFCLFFFSLFTFFLVCLFVGVNDVWPLIVILVLSFPVKKSLRKSLIEVFLFLLLFSFFLCCPYITPLKDLNDFILIILWHLMNAATVKL